MEDVAAVIKGHDLVICVVDKPRNKIIYWLNEACVKENIPFITGGVDIRSTVFYMVIPGESGCVACWRKSAMAQGHDTALEIVDIDKKLGV